MRILILVVIAAGLAAAEPLLPYQQGRLANGLEVITLTDTSCPIVAVQVHYKVGSRDEQADRTGFAHLFEHLMFRGSERMGPTGHFDAIQAAGGVCNGATGFDATYYEQVVPAGQLDLALWLESERMAFLRIDAESFATERQVVEEEYRVGREKPFGDAAEKMLPLIFPGHPYRHLPIGDLAHLRAATLAEVQAFWRDHYGPGNAVLVVAGDVVHAQVMTAAEQAFGFIPGSPVARRVNQRDPLPSAPAEHELKLARAPVAVGGIGWRTVPDGHPDTPALDLLANIAGGGRSSRAWKALVTGSPALAVQAGAMHSTMAEDGIFALYAALKPLSGDLAPALAALEREIARLRDEGPTEAEVAKVRRQALRGMIGSTLTVRGKAMALGSGAVEQGDPGAFARRLAELQAVDRTAVQRVAREHLDPQRRITMRVPASGLLSALAGGATAEAAAPPAPAAAEVGPATGRGAVRPAGRPTAPPIADAVVGPKLPALTRSGLANGVKLVVIENREVPMVWLRLQLDRGAWAEDQPGVANLTLAMLTRGTADHDEAALDELLESQALSLGGSADADGAAVSGSALREDASRLFALLGEVMLKPAFPEAALTRLKTQVITGLTTSQQDAAYLADKILDRTVFGAGHPYGRRVTGEIADVQKVTVDDLKRTWARLAVPGEATLLVAGDITAAQAQELAATALGGWTDGEVARLELPAPPEPVAARRILLVDRPGAAQSQIRLALPGFDHQDADRAVGTMLSAYFGGSFGSRLNSAVRVEGGKTYGAWGGFMRQRFAGSFEIGTFTRTDQTVATLGIIEAQLRRLRDEPPSADEIGRQRRFFLGREAADYETPTQVLGMVVHTVLNRLPDDFFTQQTRRIAAVTPEQCQELARRRLDPAQALIVVVGDAKALREPLAALAPVEVVEP